MLNALEQANVAAPQAGTGLGEPATTSAERRARGDLRRQIARLERELGELFASAFPRPGVEWGIGAPGGPRVLSLGDLERVRDSLSLRLRDARAELARRAELEATKRALLESMIAAPERHRGLVISQTEIGEPGCGRWESRPRLGILGILFGWWRVKLSSGCPLATGLRPPAPSGDLMAKRRRKRRPRRPAQAPDQRPAAPASEVAPKPAPRPRRPIEEERPPAPWGSFPLVEIVVLIAIAMLIGWLVVGGERGTALLATGLVLGSLAGLELSIREHFGGYRSHTVMLAAAAGVATLALGFYVFPDLLSPTLRLIAAAAVAIGSAIALATAFRARSGRAFKLR